MKDDFIPATQAELDTWEVNFKEKVKPIAQTLKVDDANVSDVLTQVDAHRKSYAALVAKKAEAKAATSTNAKTEKDTTKAVRQLVNRIKAADGYTEAMGNELKIIGSNAIFDKANVKPTLTVSIEGGAVVLKFGKNKTSGIHIFCRRGTEKEFSFLAVDTASPYTDSRANEVAGVAEKREYKAWHFLDDTIIGLESDVVSINK
jgi:hypothetical protein